MENNISLIEIKANLKNLILDRKAINKETELDPTLQSEEKNAIFEESERLILEAKKEYREETLKVKLNLAKKKDDLKAKSLQLKEKKAEILTAEYPSKESLSAEKNEAKLALESLELELSNKIEENKNAKTELTSKYKLDKAELTAEYKGISSNKSLKPSVKTEELNNVKMKLYDLEANFEKTIKKNDDDFIKYQASQNKKIKKTYFEYKFADDPRGLALHELKSEEKKVKTREFSKINEERDILKVANGPFYKAAINAYESLKTFGKTQKETFSSLTLFKDWVIRNILNIIIILFVLIITIMNSRFLSWYNIVNIITQSSFRLPIALGIAGAIVLTGTDLSAGRVVGLTAMLSVLLLGGLNGVSEQVFPFAADMPWIWILVVLVICMLIGGAFGAFNGFFVAKFQIHPFIVTLATQLIIYGLLQLLTSGEVFNSATTSLPYEGIAGHYREFITGGFELFDVKISWYIIYAIILTGIMWFIWNKTRFGKNMFAVGCNQEAANVSGISVKKTIILTFALAGVFYGISGFQSNPIFGGAQVSTGTNYELDAITACVIGGVSFTGGIGKISGVVIGVIFLQLLTAGLQFVGVNASVIYIIKGAVILLATSLDMKKYIAKR